MGNPKAGCRILLYCAALCLLFAGDLRADTICYEISTSWDQFGTVDLDTGAVTAISAPEYHEANLGVNDGSLYTASSGELFTVNTATGSIAPASVENQFGMHLVDMGSTLDGLYGVGYGTDDGTSLSDLGLYSISTVTGSATLVGLTGLASNTDVGLSTNSSTLYFGDGNDLYTIATTTGAAAHIGSFGAGTNTYQMGAMTTIDGVLYGADINNNTIDTINTITGAATPGAATRAIYGLVPDPLPSGGSSTPEPGSSSLLAAGTGALALAKRKMRSRVLPKAGKAAWPRRAARSFKPRDSA
jgi:hypothetical protein